MLWLVIVLWIAAAGTAIAVFFAGVHRGLEPAATGRGADSRPAWRRATAKAVLAVVLFVTVFQPLLGLAVPAPVPETVPAWQLFAVHAVLLLGLAALCALGFGGRFPLWLRHLGADSRAPARELGLGVAVGVAGWFGVLVLLLVLGLVLVALGAESLVPKTPAPLVALLGGMPWLLRLGISLSAGIFEELFFRGYLQPRIGIAASTGLFVLAHLGYGQPLLLIGVAALSLLYGFLARWRRGVLAAMAAHASFDAIQLLIVIPAVLEASGAAASAS